jgi:tetratricopeptide (TPR) repeat protein
MRRTLIPLFLCLTIALWGCAGKPRHRSHPAPTRLDAQKAQLAADYFQGGKQSYLHFRFYDSIQQLEKAVEFEINNSRKAQCLLYMGASYFYLGDTTKALQSFGLAKRYNRSAFPDKSEFPLEIIRLYEDAQ